MEGIFQLAIFMTGDGLVRLVDSFGYLLLLGVTVFILVLLLKIALDD